MSLCSSFLRWNPKMENEGSNKIPLETVKNIALHFCCFLEESGEHFLLSCRRKKHKRRSQKYDWDVKEHVRDMIIEDLYWSTKSITTELGCSDTTICQNIRDVIRYTSYTMRRGQLFSDEVRECWNENFRMVVNKMQEPTSQTSPFLVW